jgi:hypothetical protein
MPVFNGSFDGSGPFFLIFTGTTFFFSISFSGTISGTGQARVTCRCRHGRRRGTG